MLLQRARAHVERHSIQHAQDLDHQSAPSPCSAHAAHNISTVRDDRLSNDGAEASRVDCSPGMVPATPSDANEGADMSLDDSMTPMSEEMRDHIQVM